MTPPGLGAGMDGCHGTKGGVDRGQVVGGSQGHPGRRAVRVAGHVAHPADCFANGAVAGALGVRAGLAVAADAHHDQAGVARRQSLVAQAKSFHDAGAVVLHQNVGAGDQFLRYRTAFYRLEVQCNRALVAQNGGGVQRHIIHMLAHLAHRVTLGRFDLDDIRAEVGQQTGAGRAGNGGADFNDLQAGQRTHRGGIHGVPSGRDCRLS